MRSIECSRRLLALHVAALAAAAGMGCAEGGTPEVTESVRGTVSLDGSPAEGVRIVLGTEPAEGTVDATTTDSAGSYEFELREAAGRTIVVSVLDGLPADAVCEPASHSLTLASGEQAVANFSCVSGEGSGGTGGSGGAPGAAGSGGSSCASECFVDQDGDGFAAMGAAAAGRCPPCGAGFTDRSPSPGNVDCNDQSAAAFPGQEIFFPFDRGDGSFDFNCDGEAELRYPAIGNCAYNGFDCDHVEGFSPMVLPCGDQGALVDRCNRTVAMICLPELVNASQGCR